jgi:transcriptional regulator with XRE-family HTH domain
MRKLRLAVGEEIQRLRLDAGITLTELSAVTCLDRSHLRRIESAEATASVEALVAIGVALGADLSLRYFAGTGPRLVDRFQAPMVEEFLRRLSPRWSTRLEVPVETPRRGVVDAGCSMAERGSSSQPNSSLSFAGLSRRSAGTSRRARPS